MASGWDAYNGSYLLLAGNDLSFYLRMATRDVYVMNEPDCFFVMPLANPLV